MKELLGGAVTVVVIACLAGPASATAPTRPPDGRIVYTWADPDFTNEEIGLIRADGSHQQLLTHRPGFDTAAAWSPDGHRIAFTSSRSQPAGDTGPQLPYSELYVMNADGSHIRRVTTNVNLVDFEPAWSPNGRQIVVSRGSAAPPPPGRLTQPTDLWIIDLATGRERNLTRSPATWEGWPHWSPDGRRIAFEGNLLSGPGDDDDVYTISIDGTGLRRLTTQAGFDGDVRYSQDGRTLVFDSDRTGNFDLFVMRTDGTHVRQLTHDSSYEYSGSFSPDGKYIAFVSERDSSSGDIFWMRADGSQQTNITRTPLDIEFDPEWEPR